jgi:hypothetical protein
LIERGQQHRRQNSDDRDYHQQLDEGESDFASRKVFHGSFLQTVVQDCIFMHA